MTTTTVEVLVPPASLTAGEPTDPDRYGWRHVQQVGDDGAITVAQLPLTLEDVLHPEENDQVTHSDAHQRRRRYLCNVFEARFTDDPHTVVLDDVRVKWDTPDLKPYGADIMVIQGVRERRNWSTFDVGAEGVRPTLIVEITSPETRALDLTFKLDEYDLAGVPLYVIVDAVQRRGQEVLRLLGYRQTEAAYEVLSPDAQGRLLLAPLGIVLGVRENELAFYDAAGNELADYVALDAARAAAEQRAAAEAQARAAAALRVPELEAELRQLRAEA